MRTLFDKPIRKCTTEAFYSEKMDVIKFAEQIGLRENHPFTQNMILLQLDTRFIEEWAEIFLSWSEIEQE